MSWGRRSRISGQVRPDSSPKSYSWSAVSISTFNPKRAAIASAVSSARLMGLLWTARMACLDRAVASSWAWRRPRSVRGKSARPWSRL